MPAGAGTPTGNTRVAAVIGWPVRHSRSPALVNAAFAAAGLDWTMVALEVAPGQAPAAIDAMGALGLGGLSVTMPHKADVAKAVDRLTPAAAALGAANCVAWDGDALVGHSTDGAGLVEALRCDDGIDPTGWRCVVLGAGGAARSVVRALADAGAGEVVVVNRTPARGEAAAELAGAVGRTGQQPEVADSDLVINATSIAMGVAEGAEGPLPVEARFLHSGQVVVDLVYLPRWTPLLAAAARAGARPVDGLGMLVHQAKLAVALWTGTTPEVAVMAEAARA